MRAQSNFFRQGQITFDLDSLTSVVGQWALENLQEKSNGNFLYAKLMAEKLTAGVFSVYDIKRLITSMIPNDLAELYRRIYLQYPEDQREYIRYAI